MVTAPPSERGLTVAQAATVIGCNATTVRRLWREGVLAGERIGQRVLVLDAASVRAVAATPAATGRPRKGKERPAEG
jgi:excisionase family DNA binding protein